MAVRLIDGLTQPRNVDLGEGITLTLRPLGYAGMKAAEQRAFRLAVDRLADMGRAASQTVLAGEDAAAYRDELEGLAAEILLDTLIDRLATRWSGVEDEDGTPAPLTPENWRRLRSCHPWAADAAMRAIRYPAQALAYEGNVCAPSSPGN